MTRVIAPGSALGVLGGGQLGRMFAIAARRMGYRVHTFSPEDDAPAGQVADVEVTASYEDLDALRTFAHGVEVVTVDDADTVAAMRLLWQHGKQVVEPSSAITLAAVLQQRERHAGRRVGVLLSGGNVDLDALPWG